MLNRKDNKSADGAGRRGRPRGRPASTKTHRQYRRFVISHKAQSHNKLHPPEPASGTPKARSATQTQTTRAASQGTPAATRPVQAADMTETIKTLLHLAQEHGHVTYDDINDVLPDGLTPEDLDELYTKLRNLDVEIVDHAEVERAKPAEPEEEEDSRLEVLDDPVRMYMNQMGKVPLLTREQEVEICKRIEEAEVDIKRLVYSLWFHGQGAHCHRREAAVRAAQGTFRPGGGGQEGGQPRSAPAGTASADQEGPGVRCQSGRRYIAWQKTTTPGPPAEALHQVPEAGQEAAGHLPQVLLQAAGPGGHDPGGGERPREVQEQPAAHRGAGSPAQVRRAAGGAPQRTHQDPRPGAVRAPAARGVLQDVRAVEARGRPRAPGQDAHGRGQPAPGGLRRQEIHQPRPVVPRSDPGRQHRPDERASRNSSIAAATSSPPTPSGGSGRPSRGPLPTRPAPSASRCT